MDKSAARPKSTTGLVHFEHNQGILQHKMWNFLLPCENLAYRLQSASSTMEGFSTQGYNANQMWTFLCKVQQNITYSLFMNG